MFAPDSSDADSPFHRGEREVQTRLGVREKVESAGRRVLRDFMPEQHREFFAQLSFIVIGAVDAQGNPWASMLVGEPGFISSPDSRTLRIEASVRSEDPLSAALRVGANVGLLGIELHTRRRNRMNGRIVSVDAQGFTTHVAQSFGNCPKYIQKRIPTSVAYSAAGKRPPRMLDQLDPLSAALIRSADTFFIATYYNEVSTQNEEASFAGADVSHRGGKAGFVRVDDAHTVTWPDFVGNYLFNTLGNLVLNPRAGLLFPDFETGDMLYLSGRGEIIWDGEEVSAFAGAQRVVRFHIERVVHLPAALPLRWQLEEVSPFLEQTGSWTVGA